MKVGFLALSFIFTFGILFSQADYRKGFIVSLENDTVTGYVNFKTGSNAYRICQFRPAEDQPVIEYSPEEIAGYGFIKDKYFESKKVPADSPENNFAFFEVLTSGRVSLYKCDDKFYIQKYADIYKLDQSENERMVDGKRVIVITKRYIGYLNLVMEDCEPIQPKIKETELYERSLTELVEDYNRIITGSSKTYKSDKPWTNFSFGLYAGVVFSSIDFEVPSLDYQYLGGSFEKSVSPLAGISVDICWPRFTERFLLTIGASLNNARFYSYSQYSFSGSEYRNYVSIKLTELKIPFGIKFSFPEKKITPYFSLGLINTVNLKNYSEYNYEIENSNIITPYSEDILILDTHTGLFAGTGLTRPLGHRLKFYIEVRADYSIGIFANYAAESRVNSKFFNIQLDFGLLTR